MVLMALDHTRDYFGARVDPTNVATTSVALFFTRWVTHVCAPTFFLLTGTGAALSMQRRSRAGLSRFLLTRGLWLAFLEAVVIRCISYQFNVDFRVTLLIVIWALGWSMVALSALVYLPTAAIAAFGFVLVFGHNLLDGLKVSNPAWTILHRPGFLSMNPAHTVLVSYPLIPWIGVTALGFVLGSIYTWEGERRRRFLLRLAIALPLAFVALRFANVYGDPSRWSVQPTTSHTLLSFLNATKYPPSLLFLLMTLGFTMLGLFAFDREVPRWLSPVLTIGRVPLFYYILHFTLIHLYATIMAFVRYGTAHWMFESKTIADYPFADPPGWGYPLPIVYLAWMIVVISAYPVCAWYARVKARSKSPWLSYL